MTAQVPEEIFIYGTPYCLYTLPKWPDDHERIAPRSEKAAKQSLHVFGSTACRRNYVGTWEILYEKLYLKSVAGTHKLTPGPPLLAIWNSGILRVATGDSLHPLYGGFLSKFEKEHFYEFDKGTLVRSWLEKNEK